MELVCSELPWEPQRCGLWLSSTDLAEHQKWCVFPCRMASGTQAMTHNWSVLNRTTDLLQLHEQWNICTECEFTWNIIFNFSKGNKKIIRTNIIITWTAPKQLLASHGLDLPQCNSWVSTGSGTVQQLGQYWEGNSATAGSVLGVEQCNSWVSTESGTVQQLGQYWEGNSATAGSVLGGEQCNSWVSPGSGTVQQLG